LCEQNSGQCFCKQFVDTISCSECKSGSYKLERDNIFGCQSCDCQIGSSVDNNCDKITGRCTCLPNIIGQKCDRPADGFFLPDMHQFKYELEEGYSNNKRNKQVRYDFDETVFPEFSWKGYVHLNKANGEVSQDIVVKEPGTYRMIVRYVNMNSNITEVFVRVKSAGKGDDQNATIYLAPAVEPRFETVTVNQISALALELESSNYAISFQNKQEKLYIDYFVLLPSNYFESTGLELNVEQACTDYRNEELCLQYMVVSLDSFSPKLIYDSLNSDNEILVNQTVDLDFIKEFNHSYKKPMLAVKLGAENWFSKNVKFPNINQNYTLLIDFLNLNDDGKEISIEVTNSDSKIQQGKVYLYKCNLT
jgi:laminin alpha 3/5